MLATFDSVVVVGWLIVMSFLQLHDFLNADEHYIGASYKIVEIFVHTCTLSIVAWVQFSDVVN